MMAQLKASRHMRNNDLQKMAGLTLIEVLIALAIISIAFTAIILSTAQNIRNTQYVQNKQIATWVGAKVMNEALAGILVLPESDTLNGETEVLGRKLFWKAGVQATPNPKIHKINVQVAETENAKKLISLVSYAYK